jgi:hypothetical protein
MKRMNNKAGEIDNRYGFPLRRMRHKKIKGNGNTAARFKASQQIRMGVTAFSDGVEQ